MTRDFWQRQIQLSETLTSSNARLIIYFTWSSERGSFVLSEILYAAMRNICKKETFSSNFFYTLALEFPITLFANKKFLEWCLNVICRTTKVCKQYWNWTTEIVSSWELQTDHSFTQGVLAFSCYEFLEIDSQFSFKKV